VKGSVFRGRLQFDMTAFRFDLVNAIVRRTNAAGSEYFINAGGTRQQGLELFVQGYPVRTAGTGTVREFRLWSSVTYSDFSFRGYAVNATSYEGKSLTGVPGMVVVSGTDIRLAKGFSCNVTFNHTGRLPLTDANDAYAEAYGLWQVRAGWQREKGRHRPGLFVGVDNLTNEAYSLGHDLNAFGKRYYNPAPGRNYFAGAYLRF
jgi:iron complex outermembrane receptor protein